MPINYNPTTWVNNQNPPISADNLNHIENGIKATADRVDELVTVEANPSETPTATMESLEVDGTIYKVGGGHAVKDSSGTTMTQRENLQFTDAHTSDDSQGNTTKVEIAKQVTSAEWENATEQGFYLIGDDDDYLLDISQVANADATHLPYSSTQSTKQKIDEVNGSIPTKTSQLTNDSSFIKLYSSGWGTSIIVPQSMCTLILVGTTVRGVQIYSYNSYINTVTNVSATETLTATKNADNTVTFTASTAGQISVLVM